MTGSRHMPDNSDATALGEALLARPDFSAAVDKMGVEALVDIIEAVGAVAPIDDPWLPPYEDPWLHHRR